MDLGELLDELRANILRDASDEVGPHGDDRLWSDQTLVRYINDAQDQFAVQTCLLRDETTPAVTRLTLVEGQEVYALDPRVIAVFDAKLDKRHLARSTYGALTSGAGDVVTGGVRYGPRVHGTPRMFYTDRETGKLGLWPAPDTVLDGSTLTLRVARRPLAPLSYGALKAVPEIPVEFHLDLLEWAAWRALRNRDVDAESMSKASMHKKRFEDTLKELSRKAKRLLAQDIQFDTRGTNWS